MSVLPVRRRQRDGQGRQRRELLAMSEVRRSVAPEPRGDGPAAIPAAVVTLPLGISWDAAPWLGDRDGRWHVWRAALSARLAYLVHLIRGHSVLWRTTPPDVPLCSGDIACGTCRQVLWCRAFDPWRPAARDPGPAPNDHWGAPISSAALLVRRAMTLGRDDSSESRTSVAPSAHQMAMLVDGFSHVLRLAERLPSGASEDQVRRAVCELIEVDAGPQQQLRLDHLFSSIGRLQQERGLGRRRVQQAGSTAIERLLEALSQEVLPILCLPHAAAALSSRPFNFQLPGFTMSPHSLLSAVAHPVGSTVIAVPAAGPLPATIDVAPFDQDRWDSWLNKGRLADAALADKFRTMAMLVAAVAAGVVVVWIIISG